MAAAQAQPAQDGSRESSVRDLPVEDPDGQAHPSTRAPDSATELVPVAPDGPRATARARAAHNDPGCSAVLEGGMPGIARAGGSGRNPRRPCTHSRSAGYRAPGRCRSRALGPVPSLTRHGTGGAGHPLSAATSASATFAPAGASARASRKAEEVGRRGLPPSRRSPSMTRALLRPERRWDHNEWSICSYLAEAAKPLAIRSPGHLRE